MSTSHTLIALCALVLLSTMLVGFNNRAAMSAFDVGTSKDNLAMTALGSSYIEFSQGLAFDSYSDTASVLPGMSNLFTPPAALGPDGLGEDTLTAFNDFDDLNGYVGEASGPDGRIFRAHFTVRYVQPDNVNSYTTTQTFAKRLDVRLWRSFPLFAGNERADTLRLSYVMGYFLFE